MQRDLFQQHVDHDVLPRNDDLVRAAEQDAVQLLADAYRLRDEIAPLVAQITGFDLRHPMRAMRMRGQGLRELRVDVRTTFAQLVDELEGLQALTCELAGAGEETLEQLRARQQERRDWSSYGMANRDRVLDRYTRDLSGQLRALEALRIARQSGDPDRSIGAQEVVLAAARRAHEHVRGHAQRLHDAYDAYLSLTGEDNDVAGRLEQ